MKQDPLPRGAAAPARGLQGGVRHLLRLPDGTELSSGDVAGAALRDFTLTEAVNDESELTPGAACAACVTAELWCPAGVPVTAGQEFACYRLRGEERELLGLFTAEKPTRATANTCRLTAYDRMTRTDMDLSPWLRAAQSSFPMPLQAFARAVCAQCGLELGGDALPNGAYPVPAFYADGLSGRRLLQWIGQAAGRFCRITPDGKLEFAWYTPAPAGRSLTPGGGARQVVLRLAGRVLRAAGPRTFRLAVDQWWYYRDTLHYEDFATAPIDAVQLRQTQSDVGVLWPEQPAGANVLALTGNLLLGGAKRDLQTVAQTLYEQLKGITYTPCRVEVPADSGLRAGMVVAAEDRNGRRFVTYITDCALHGGAAALTGTGHATRGASTAVYRRSLRNQAGRMLELETDVDGLRLKASELSGDFAQLTLDVEGFQTTVEKTYATKKERADGDAGTLSAARSEIKQTAESIKLSVSNGTDSSTFTLKAGETTLSSGTITFSGLVNFVSKSDIYTSGKTTIDGGRITTGTVTASQLSLKDLSDTKATLGGWTLSATRIRSSASIYMGAKEAGMMLINEPNAVYLYAQNANGQRTFSIDRTGNATFAGSLSAATGTFAGELQAAKGTFAGSLSAATGTFAGELKAATGSFSGTVEASAGHIGEWTINNGNIYNGVPYTGTASSNSTGMGSYGTDWAFWAGDGRFSVKQNGHLHAEDADITGTVRATDGYFAGTVYANRIAVGGDYGYITGAQIGGATITGGNIGAATISGGNIGGDTVTRGNLQEKYATSAQYNTLSADVASMKTIVTSGGIAADAVTTRALTAYGGFTFLNKAVHWKTIYINGTGYTLLCDST